LRSSVARGDIEQTISSLRLIAGAYRATGRPDHAAHSLQVALALSEAVPIDELDGETRATYLATQHTVFAELTDLFATQTSADAGTAWQAFAVSERGRARSLRYAESQEARDAALAFNAPPAASYQRLVREVVQLNTSSPADSPQALIDALGGMAQRDGQPADSLDRTRIQRTLQGLDATLVEYAVGPHDMFAFVLDANTLGVVRLGDRAVISTAVSQLRDRLRDPESPASTVQQAARRLAELVIWPVQSKIAARRIIFVPDDSLHTIPFAVLPWSSEAQAPLLVQRAETVVAPSALFLTHARVAGQASSAAPRIELIGDPVFRISDWRRECLDGGAPAEPLSARGRSTDRAVTDWTESLPRLPGTRTEVSAIAKLARQTRPGIHLETLLGCAAVPSALRAAADRGADLLHIATHALVDAERPRLSALALTPDPQTSPPTSAFGLLDILGLKLRSRLVVLSACDTSRGRLLPGEGVLGPAQAFLQAGSAAVLASYWRIDDAATASFMQRFYMHLFAEHLPAAAALRSAQLEAARNSSSHTWAAFALYGWPDSSI
jgi:CHAT domain-containing protein